MGYNLHISRKENWYDDDASNEIPLEEWTDYVKNDEEMRLDGVATADTIDGEQFSMVDEGLSVWTAYSQDGINNNHAWFWYDRGNIVVKNPDPEIRNKMIAIADVLDARVQGDDGEFYDEESVTITGEFRIAKGWKIFILIFTPLLITLFVWVGIIAIGYKDLWVRLLMMSVSAAAILFFLYAMLESLAMRLTIQDNIVSYKSLFRNRHLSFDQIKGIRINDNEIKIIPLEVTGRTISVSKYLSQSSEIFNWLTTHFGGLDRFESFKEEVRILNSDEFGITSASREFRLREARIVARFVNIIGVAVAIWLWLFPTPYTACVVVGMIVPLLAIVSVYYCRGLIRFDEKKNSPYPSVAYGFLFPATGLAFRAAMDFELLEYNSLWGVVLILAIMLSGLVIAGTREIKFSDWVDYLQALLFTGLMLFYTFGMYVILNCEFDKSTPQIFRANVVAKEMSSGKITSYYLKLTPWGPRKDVEKISVTKNQYKTIVPGDTVEVHLLAGSFKTPWCYVSK